MIFTGNSIFGHVARQLILNVTIYHHIVAGLMPLRVKIKDVDTHIDLTVTNKLDSNKTKHHINFLD